MPFTHIDCFSGVGGICTGFHAAGFDTRVAIEHIRSCVDTYSANHPNVHIIHSDIRDATAEQILPYIPADGVSLVSSGMPCETFSTAGNTSRSFYDDRQFLFREGIRIAQISNAKLILFKNVPAITTKTVSKQSSVLIVEVLKKELAAAGYGNYLEIVLNSVRYGVPQKRDRFFILACRYPDWQLSYPLPSCNKDTPVIEAFAGLPSVMPNGEEYIARYERTNSRYAALMRDDDFWKRGGGVCGKLSYQKAMKHRPATLERFSLTHQGECTEDLFDRFTAEEIIDMQERKVLPKKKFHNRYWRLVQDMPSPTLTSHCLDAFVHPIHNRALTVRECARLQSFPDSYDFCGGPYVCPHNMRDVQDKYEQVGDAVPPLLAYAWGMKITEILEENNNAANH